MPSHAESEGHYSTCLLIQYIHLFVWERWNSQH